MFSYNDLKQAHERAKDRGADVFVFLHRQFVTKFAFYLLEYIDIICEKKGLDRDEKFFSFENHTEEIFMPGESLN